MSSGPSHQVDLCCYDVEDVLSSTLGPRFWSRLEVSSFPGPSKNVITMAQRHLLPCPHCETRLSIEPTQAGQTTGCPECSQVVPIPTLRKIRELPLDENQVAESTAQWSFERRSMFAGGLAAFLIGVGITVVFLLLRSQLDTEIPPIPEEEAFLAIVENTPIDGLWLKWKESVRSTELGDWVPSPVTIARRQARLYLQISIVTGVIALGGLGTSVFSLVCQSKS